MQHLSFTRSKGFSLLEMAVVLVIAGLMLGIATRTQLTGITSGGGGDASSCYTQTQKQLATIRDALSAYERKNQRLPFPAGRSLGSNDVKFGHETVLPADIANIDRVGALLFGALPFQALGLGEYYAADCWGNKFTYVVTETLTSNATTGGYPDTSVTGGITLQSGTGATLADASASPSTGLSYAVISHGETGVGAVKKNYSGASHGWCSVGTAADTQNCDISNNVLTTANFNNGANAGAAFYDDLMVFGGKLAVAKTVVPAIYAWGANYGQGRIGDGATDHRLKPVRVYLPGNAIPAAVYAGVAQSCALDVNGNAYCWGLNGDGNGGTLGNGTAPTTVQLVPVAVTMPTGVKFTKLAVGHRHNCGLGDNGQIYCWGDNTNGNARGDGVVNLSWHKPTNPTNLPSGVTKFTDVVARDNINCALGDNAKAYCWGNGNWRQNGDGTTSAPTTPTLVTMPAGITFTQFAAGYFSMCAVGSDKKMYCWGTNVHRQFGNNAAASGAPLLAFDGPVTKAIGGGALTCSILTNKQTWCFGDEAGTGGAGPGIYPTQETMPAGVLNYVDVGIGSDSRCGIGNDGQVYCKGKNDRGQLGNGTGTDSSAWVRADFSSLGVTRITQVAGYEQHYVAIGEATPGDLQCWGRNIEGQAPATVTGKFLSVSGGSRHTCALNYNGDVQCWGQYEDNRWGPPPALTAGPFIQLSVSKITATCMRMPNQDIHCLQDSNATIGYGEAPNTVTGPFIQLSEGYAHGCGLKQNGDVQCYGLNDDGGAPSSRTGPYSKISSGYYHTCGLKPNGDADCWGRNWDGQAPGVTTGPFTQIAAGHLHTCALRSNGNVKCWGSNVDGQAPTTDIVGPFTEVSVNFHHSCAVKTNGDVQCWGLNDSGQAPSTVTGPLYGITAGRDHTCAIKYKP